MRRSNLSPFFFHFDKPMVYIIGTFGTCLFLKLLGVSIKLVLFDVQSSLRRLTWRKIVFLSKGCLDHFMCISDDQNVHPIGAKTFPAVFSNDLRVLATSRQRVPGVGEVLTVVFAHFLPKIPWQTFMDTKISRSYVDFLIRYLISLDISYLNTGDVLRLCWNCASSKLWDQKTRPERLWVPRSRWLPGGLSNDQRKTTMTPTNLGWLDTKLWWILLNFS